MDLKTFRYKNNIRMCDLAKMLNKTPQHIYEIERGSAFPSRNLALRIEQATGGMVTLRELLFPATGEGSGSAVSLPTTEAAQPHPLPHTTERAGDVSVQCDSSRNTGTGRAPTPHP